MLRSNQLSYITEGGNYSQKATNTKKRSGRRSLVVKLRLPDGRAPKKSQKEKHFPASRWNCWPQTNAQGLKTEKLIHDLYIYCYFFNLYR